MRISSCMKANAYRICDMGCICEFSRGCIYADFFILNREYKKKKYPTMTQMGCSLAVR
jgi:hypothetical protein